MNPTRTFPQKSLAIAGQAITEFLLIAVLSLLASAGAVKLLYRHWQKSKCVILVFEKTHQALRTRNGAHGGLKSKATPNFPTFSTIVLEEKSDRWIGTGGTGGMSGLARFGSCEGFHEVVELPKLEFAQW